MSVIEAIASTIHQVNHHPTIIINVGSKVRIPDGRMGKVQTIDISPYYTEEKQGVLRGYVVNLDNEPAFADYFLAEELQFVAVRA